MSRPTPGAVEDRRVVFTMRSDPVEPEGAGEVEPPGLTLDGYAAVFNTPALIHGWDEDFEEVFQPGAFSEVLGQGMPVLMFDHGTHPLIGSMPLGVITTAAEEAAGLHIVAALSDNWLIEPVRDAIADGAVTGMSIRFAVEPDGQIWETRPGQPPLRTIVRVARLPELGPVVFPAYTPTTATIRSALTRMDPPAGSPGTRSAGSDGSTTTPPGSGAVTALDHARHRALRLKGLIP